MNAISIFIPSFALGGAERNAATLANAFAARGYAVDVVVADSGGPVRSDIRPPVHIVDLHARRVRAAILPLRRYLQEVRPRALLCLQAYAGWAGVIARDLSGTVIPVIIVEQSMTMSRLKGLSTLRYLAARMLTSLLYPRAAAVVGISEQVRRDLMTHAGLPASLLQVIHNPAALPVIEGLQSWDGGVPTSWPVTGNPVVATVCRLVAVKDVATLLRGFARLRKQRPLSLAIIGDGPERDNLEALARQLGVENDTHFLGARDKPWRYLTKASAFVMSSRFEGFGNTLVEAMVVGCPVISTDCPGGPREILADGQYGPLVPVGDYEALACAIGHVLDNPPPRDLLSERGREFGENIIDQYIALIDRISPRSGHADLGAAIPAP